MRFRKKRVKYKKPKSSKKQKKKSVKKTKLPSSIEKLFLSKPVPSIYISIISFIVLGFFLGLAFVLVLPESYISSLDFSFINQNYDFSISLFLNSLFEIFFKNFKYIILIWCFGFIGIGISATLLILTFRFFAFGFTLNSIFMSTDLSETFLYTLSFTIQNLFLVAFFILISYISISFSLSKEKNNRDYLSFLGFCSIICFLFSFVQTVLFIL